MRGRLRGEGVANGDTAHRAAMLCIVASTACVRPETYDGPIDTSVAVMTLGGGPLIAPLSPGTIALEGRLLFVLGLSRPLVDFAPETRDADKRVVALVEADAPRARPLPWVEAFSADNDRLDALPELEGYFLPALDEDACTRSGGCLDVASDPPRASEEWCRVPCPEPPEPDPPKPAARPRPVGASADCGMRAVAEPPDEAGPRRCVAPRVEIPSCPEGQIPGLGACSPLSACPPGRFPADLDDTRTLFIDGAARARGTGTRDSPLDRIEVAAIGPDVDVIAASGRLSFPVDPLPARPLSIRGSCIERLTLVGKARSSSRLTIEDARIEATVLIDRGEFSARRVAWSGGLLRVGDPSGVDAGAAATLEAASIVHTGGAPLVMVERARFSLERALVTGTGTSAVISADRAEVRIRGLDAVGPQLVDARASRIEAQQVRSRASPRRSLFTVDGSSLTLDGFAAQTLRAPVVRAKGSEVTVRDSGLTGEASTLIELSGGMLRGQGLALRLAGGPSLLDSALSASDAEVSISGLDAEVDRGGLASVSNSAVRLLDLVALRSQSRGMPDANQCVRPQLSIAGERSHLELSGALLQGAPPMLDARLGGDVALEDLAVEGVVPAASIGGCPGYALQVQASRARLTRVSVTGLERVLTLRADARLGEQILEDLTVSDVGDDDNACERNMPAAIIVSPSTSSLTMSRIRLDRLERRGIVISGSGATVNVEDLDGHDVKCKFLEAAGGAQVRARRLAATRTALAETGVIRNDDLLTTTGTSSLLVTDARFELSTARSLLRSTKGGRFRLERWHATAADALLYVDDLTPSTPDDAEPQSIRDGKVVSVRRAAVPSVGSCARLRAARLFVRVSVPPDTDFWSTCR